ncbi:4-amino-4-deoxy-L-arabinose-phosphoundecaprenol flippase subunit ArnE [Enhygromyxa salina]|uniref:4-amino-4-deoxy-L-arabinose-phosphoundecaprenol flippase subunit ArnE n=1 Tax=Enhygromyxa salina TaxID=215803 RepID=A0A2S9XB72_9BACT|nr:DMT family transporter [Enhygromyxa salina]PRP90098.1 4-amino-4-deoxy-L-arabinose-phosphoundecaprenol flippase subunit ArnE [Enhygromyxa salina]
MVPIGGLALAVVCAFAWAGLDVVRKQLSAALAPMPLIVLLNLGLLPVFGAWWVIAGGTITDASAYAVPGGLALALQLVANLLFLAAVRASPLSLTVPFLALTPVFATLVGALTLGERPGPLQLLGVALVVVGALILGSREDPGRDLGSGSGQQRVRLLRVFVTEPGAPMMAGVALCWGVTMTLDKQALAYAAVPVHALVQLFGLLVAALAYLAVRGQLRELAVPRSQWPGLALATVTGAIALGVQLVAVQWILVSVLETVKRALGLVSAVVFGKLIFDEAITLTKAVAICVMAVGVVLVML